MRNKRRHSTSLGVVLWFLGSLGAGAFDPLAIRPHCAAEADKNGQAVDVVLPFSTQSDPADRCKALSALEARARAGDVESAVMAGTTFETGKLVERDRERAEAFLLLAYDAGSAEAALRLGDLLREGAVDRAAVAAANAYYEDARSLGSAEAAARLGDYLLSIGDYEGAVSSYRDASARGFLPAAVTLGRHYLEGRFGEKDPDAAMAAFQAAEQAGSPDATIAIASLWSLQGDAPRAIATLREGIGRENDAAAIALGDIYRDGRGVATDIGGAIAIYREAAGRGLAAAFLRIGDIFRDGVGVEADPVKAAREYQKALSLDDPAGAMRLGDLLRLHPHLSDNPNAALDAYRDAFALGEDMGAARAGEILMAGASDGAARQEAAILLTYAPDDIPDDLVLSVAQLMRESPAGVSRGGVLVGLYQRAVAAGTPGAARELGDLYLEGLTIPRDVASAERAYELSGESMPADTLLALGMAWQEEEPAGDRAKVYFDRALDAGSAAAGIDLGNLLLSRSETDVGALREAVDAFVRAAELGEPSGLLPAGDALLRLGGEDDHPERAAALYGRALDAGVPGAASRLGNLHYEGLLGERDLTMALHYYDLDGEGVPDRALLDMAGLLAGGSPVERARAAQLYEQALRAGLEPAAAALGDLHLSGALGKVDPGLAESIFALSSQPPGAEILIRLGNAYRDGTGADPDLAKAVQYYELAASQGSDAASRFLGDLFFDGEHLPPDFDRAARYYEAAPPVPDKALLTLGDFYLQRAAARGEAETAIAYYEAALKAGFGEAAERLGELYFAGVVVDRDLERAASFFDLAPRGPPTKALVVLGDYFRDALGDGRLTRAKELYHEALLRGDGEAAGRLGDFYFSGLLGEVDLALAEHYYQQSGGGVPTSAALALGDAYRDGAGIPRDPAKATAYYEAALAGGDMRAARRLGDLNFLAGSGARDLIEAARYYDKAPDLDVDVLLTLADAFLAGQDVDPSRATGYLERAAAAGSVQAHLRLGELFRDGEHVPNDPSRAERSYLEAARLGSGEATLRLAEGYISGALGNAPNRGVELLRQAADNGDPEARLILAEVLLNDGVVAPQPIEAAALLEAAIASGDRAGGMRLVRLYRQGMEGFDRRPDDASRILEILEPELGSNEFAVQRALTNLRATGLPSSVHSLAEAFSALEPFRRAEVLSDARTLNENVYVYLLQVEVLSRGLTEAAPSGQLTSTTIRAILEMCGDQVAICESAGPLSERAGAVIADAVAL